MRYGKTGGVAIAESVQQVQVEERAYVRSAEEYASQVKRPGLLAAVAVAGVLLAVLVVFTSNQVPAPGAPSAIRWSELRLAKTPADLGPTLARDVEGGLAAAHAALRPCFAAEAQRARGGEPATAGSAEPGAPAIVVLRLAGRPGTLAIEAIEIERRGSASRELLQCARQVLEGRTLAVRGAVPGRGHRLSFPLE